MPSKKSGKKISRAASSVYKNKEPKDTPGKRCPVCELVLLRPEPPWYWEYTDEPHSDLKECMLVMISDLRHTISKLEDRVSEIEGRLLDQQTSS